MSSFFLPQNGKVSVTRLKPVANLELCYALCRDSPDYKCKGWLFNFYDLDSLKCNLYHYDTRKWIWKKYWGREPKKVFDGYSDYNLDTLGYMDSKFDGGPSRDTYISGPRFCPLT